MSVLYFNNCWFTNVGEAFIDIGAMELLKRVFKNKKIINLSRMNYIYIKDCIDKSKLVYPKFLNMWDYMVCDDVEYIVLAGMFGCKSFIDSLNKDNGDFLRDLIRKNVKVIFLGLGQELYTEAETEYVISFLKEINPKLIVSRDDLTYNNLKNDFNVIKGIDCAFWVRDVYEPILNSKKYDVVTYNRSIEPKVLNVENEIVRAYHFQYKMVSKHIKDNMLVSDSPYDYITLYANAQNVYTDLVHATIISLQYGKRVLFEGVDKRTSVVDALIGLEKDEKRMLHIDLEMLEKQKNQIEKAICEALA